MILSRLALALALLLSQLGPPIARAQCPPGVANCPAPRPQRLPQASPDRIASDLAPPWHTVVRVRIRQAENSQEIGSGTIVVSTPSQSLVLTCAHVFEATEGESPATFARPIAVDLFDGQFRQDGPHAGQQLTYRGETHAGKAVAWDRARDVGLISFTPGRTLERSPVVDAAYRPEVGEKFTALGCDLGVNAIAWTTVMVRDGVQMKGKPAYQGIECRHNPKQGRSGGGLYTLEGKVAGVCDFGGGSTGIYAHPSSIRRILAQTGFLEAAEATGVTVQVGPNRTPAAHGSRVPGDSAPAWAPCSGPLQSDDRVRPRDPPGHDRHPRRRPAPGCRRRGSIARGRVQAAVGRRPCAVGRTDHAGGALGGPAPGHLQAAPADVCLPRGPA